MLVPSIPRRWLVALCVLYVLIVVYAVVVMQQILLGVFLPALVVGLAYVAWRVWRVFRMHEQKLEEETRTTGGRPREETAENPVETLKRRYADGELSDAEFERELERLLEADEPAGGTVTNVEPDGTEREKAGTSVEGNETN